MGSDSDPMAGLNERLAKFVALDKPACSGFRQFFPTIPNGNFERTDLSMVGRKKRQNDSGQSGLDGNAVTSLDVLFGFIQEYETKQALINCF